MLTHPYRPKLDYETKRNEIFNDVNNLERMSNMKIKGLALPYRNFDENTWKVLKECGLKWCRLCGTTMKFDMPKNLPLFFRTCHFMNKEIFKLAEQFIGLNPEGTVSSISGDIVMSLNPMIIGRRLKKALEDAC